MVLYLIRGFVNGNIYVSFKPLRKAESMLVVGEKVAYVGEKGVVEAVVSRLGGELVDLGGRTVLPGFIDAHVHPDELGLYLSTLDLRGTRSIKELKERLRKYAEAARTTWVLGHGWDQELFEEGRWPTRYDLDEVVAEKPVLLSRICLHAGVLNTKAVELAGLFNLKLPGVLRDEQGVPTGVVKEEAFELVRQKVEETLTIEDYAEFIERALHYAASMGITTVGFVSCGLKQLKAVFKLWSEKRLPVRVRVYLSYRDELVEAVKQLGIRRGFGDGYLKILGFKILADGSLGARTAWLSEPYSDDPSTSGYPLLSEEELKRAVRKVDEAGLQLAIHGIGDKAIDTVLRAYMELNKTREKRHRLEHASVLRDDQVELMAELGVVAVVQPHFVISDWWVKNRLGEKRVHWVYRFKTLAEKGVELAFSTDSPVEPLNPWETVYAAVTRGKYENVPYYEDTREECLSTLDSLHYYTWGSAYALFEEDALGSLEEGKYADFVVVDRDPLVVSEEELKSIRVLETYVGGKKAWSL